jgi:hypothetical protein
VRRKVNYPEQRVGTNADLLAEGSLRRGGVDAYCATKGIIRPDLLTLFEGQSGRRHGCGLFVQYVGPGV